MSRRSRQPIVDDEDDGFTSTKWVPPSQRSLKPVQEMNKQELETEALSRNSEVTDATLNLRRLTEQTKDVAGQTMVTLNEQGEQIRRIHEKAVVLDQELEKGEKVLGKLGGLFSLPWRPKKGKKITGPKDLPSDGLSGFDPETRAKLGLSAPKAGAAPPTGTEDMTAVQRIEMEQRFQDQVLDDVSSNLDALKKMAQAMGAEMGKQDKGLDGVQEDVKPIDDRLRQANTRQQRLLGRR